MVNRRVMAAEINQPMLTLGCVLITISRACENAAVSYLTVAYQSADVL
jgi:hypothetical protein